MLALCRERIAVHRPGRIESHRKARLRAESQVAPRIELQVREVVVGPAVGGELEDGADALEVAVERLL